MTEEECIEKLQEWVNAGDTETAHGECDGIVLEFLKEKYPKIAEKYEEVQGSHGGFWYA